jgi:hypothetical protein
MNEGLTAASGVSAYTIARISPWPKTKLVTTVIIIKKAG